MAKSVYDRFYSKVPQEQKERLRIFRSTHPHKHLTVDGVTWKYTSCGQGENALLLLTGGTGIGEAMAMVFSSLENRYRLVSPTYPPVTTIGQLIGGIITILDSEGVGRVSVFGQSLGGMLAQVVVREYPERIDKLMLSHTLTTSPPVNRAIVLEDQKERERFLRIAPFLPLGVIRYISRKRLSRHISAMGTEEGEFWKAYFHEMLSYVTREYLVADFQCMSDFFQNYTFSSGDLADWPGEVLILESDNDIIPCSVREAIRELYPRAQVHTFHGTGHMTIVVNREEFVSAVRDFLANDVGATS
jgi:pimeloyl-ACP methyl ester carboxylesterase